jgi:hypothetical protein
MSISRRKSAGVPGSMSVLSRAAGSRVMISGSWVIQRADQSIGERRPREK